MKRAQDLETLTETALQIGQERVCKEIGLFTAWLESASSKPREPAKYFGQISTYELITDYLLNPHANRDQHHAAAMAIHERYLADNRVEVLSEARRAMEA